MYGIVNELKILTTRMLQDVIVAIINTYSVDKDWKQEVFKVAEKEKDGKRSIVYKDNYINMVKKSDKYEVTDMDITFMTNLLLSNSLVFGVDLSYAHTFKDQIKAIKDDRCYASHMNANESFSELYQMCLVTISNLNKFLSSFCQEKKFEKIENRYEILKDYSDKILAISDVANKKCEEYYHNDFRKLAFMHDIEKLKKYEGKKREDLWNIITQKYMAIASIDKDFSDVKMFMKTAAENDVQEAFKDAARYFYEDGEYYKAAKYYEKIKKNLLPNQMLDLANIYINNWASSNKQNEGKELLNKVEEYYEISPINNENKEEVWVIINRKKHIR